MQSFPGSSEVKGLPAMWENRVRSLGWEDPLEKEMETHSSFLIRRISWTEESGRLQSVRSQRVRHDWVRMRNTTNLKLIGFSNTVVCWYSRLPCVALVGKQGLCMKCSLGISNFLEGISSLPHSIVFLYFLALITEEGFLISPCYFLELCIQMGKHPLRRAHEKSAYPSFSSLIKCPKMCGRNCSDKTKAKLKLNKASENKDVASDSRKQII